MFLHPGKKESRVFSCWKGGSKTLIRIIKVSSRTVICKFPPSKTASIRIIYQVPIKRLFRNRYLQLGNSTPFDRKPKAASCESLSLSENIRQ
jgi:hypothetical protein